jgi:hypothetical protein
MEDILVLEDVEPLSEWQEMSQEKPAITASS